MTKFLNNYEHKGYEGDFVNLGPLQKPENHTGQPNGNGRVNAIAFHPTDPDKLYLGAPAGGLWISSDGGAWWQCYTDYLPTLGVSSIVIDYQNPDIIYIGTGDRDAGDARGMGVFKSMDGGQTFTPFNSEMEDAKVGRMIMHPDNHLILFAATSRGLFKTTDGGQTWEKKKNGNFKEIVFKPGMPSVIYASRSGDFYKSTDNGETWVKNYQTGNHDRAVIGVSPADPEVVYFVTVNNSSYGGTYKSDDSGETWTLMSDTPNIMSWGCNGGDGGQGWYDLDVAVDPLNANIVYVAGVNVFKSIDGGQTWNISSHWVGSCGVAAVHADCHVLEFNPLNNTLYAGNDGGIYYTDNGGLTWPEISDGLAIGQIYRIGQSALEKDNVISGYQDNGTATYVGDDQPFVTVMGGDGMDCLFDYQDPKYSYGTIYFGQIFRFKNNYYNATITDGISESGAWVTPYILDAQNPNVMYVGMKNLWKGVGIKTSNITWTKITNTGNNNIRVVEQNAKNPKILYYARFDKQGLFRTDNLYGLTVEWENLKNYLPEVGEITDVETSPVDENIVYITINNKVYKSYDKGLTWEDITLNIPEISINTIEYYKNDVEGLYVGTDAGIFYKNASMDEWILFANGFPLSSNVLDLEFYYDSLSPAGDLVRVSTYGRGLWSSPTWYGELQADFETSDTLIPLGCSLDFKDKSIGVPHQWHWYFEGGEPSESFEKNPQGIQYNTEGVFQVKLVVTNPMGSAEKVKQGYITVGQAVKPNVNFTSSYTAVCAGGQVSFEDHSSGCPQSWLWSFNPSTVTFVEGTNATSQNPVVKFNEAGMYDVSLTVSNVAGDSTLTKEHYVMAGGASLPFAEDFETDDLKNIGWTVVNPDGNKTWKLISVTGVNDQTTTAPYINFFKYYYTGQRDELISPPVNFAGFENVFMTFDYAYAQKFAQIDSLIVKVSSDCGESWTRVYADGPDMTEHFVTREPLAVNFEPEVKEDWSGRGNYGADSPLLDLSEWAGQSNIRIAFESYCGYGNNLYIDNIAISNAVGLNNKKDDKSVKYFPNPTTNMLTVVLEKSSPSTIISLRSVSGVEVKRLTGVQKINRLDVRELPVGVYLLQVINKDRSFTGKVIVE